MAEVDWGRESEWLWPPKTLEEVGEVPRLDRAAHQEAGQQELCPGEVERESYPTAEAVAASL